MSVYVHDLIYELDFFWNLSENEEKTLCFWITLRVFEKLSGISWRWFWSQASVTVLSLCCQRNVKRKIRFLTDFTTFFGFGFGFRSWIKIVLVRKRWLSFFCSFCYLFIFSKTIETYGWLVSFIVFVRHFSFVNIFEKNLKRDWRLQCSGVVLNLSGIILGNCVSSNFFSST